MPRSSRCTDCQVSQVKLDTINLDTENFPGNSFFILCNVKCKYMSLFWNPFTWILCPVLLPSILYMLKCVEYVFAYVTVLRHPCRRSLFYLYTPADGFYAQCFVRVSPGEKVLTMEETPEGYGKEEKFVTLKHDYESFQSAPKFLDDPKVRECSFFLYRTFLLHSFFFDNYPCLIV